MSNPYIEYYPNGNKKIEHYYKDLMFHNESGPAIIDYYENGNISEESFYLNDLLHNENGPAVIDYNTDGTKKGEYYYLNDLYLININSIEELKRYIKLQNIT